MEKQEPLFCLAETKQKGRVVAAIKPIPPYYVVLKEPSIATVLYTTARTMFCSYCTDKLSGNSFTLKIDYNLLKYLY